MKQPVAWAVGTLLAVLFPWSVAQAEPTFGASCGSGGGCHTADTGKMSIAGSDTTFGGLKVFTVDAGATANLMIDVINGANLFDPRISNLDGGGLNVPADKLLFTKDPTWLGDHSGSAPPYFTFAANGIIFSSPTSSTYHLSVLPSTPHDYYLVLLGVAGQNPDFTRWSQTENVYVHVVPEPAMLVLLLLGLGALALRWRTSA